MHSPHDCSTSPVMHTMQAEGPCITNRQRETMREEQGEASAQDLNSLKSASDHGGRGQLFTGWWYWCYEQDEADDLGNSERTLALFLGAGQTVIFQPCMDVSLLRCCLGTAGVCFQVQYSQGRTALHHYHNLEYLGEMNSTFVWCSFRGHQQAQASITTCSAWTLGVTRGPMWCRG
jgi:hypothetical protein